MPVMRLMDETGGQTLKNYVLTKDGMTMELNEADMLKIIDYFDVQCIVEYIEDNFSIADEEKILLIARLALDLKRDYQISEEEAVKSAIARVK